MTRHRALGVSEPPLAIEWWAVAFGVVSVTAGAIAIGCRVAAARRKSQAGLNGSPMAAARSRKHPKLLSRQKTGDMTLSVYNDADMPIDMRVGLIQDLTREAKDHPEIKALASAIVGAGTRSVKVGKYTYVVHGANCGPDARCMVDAIGRWTAKHVRYTGDVAPVKMGRNGPVEAIDLFQSARRTLEIGGEDCDGHSNVNCSLIESLGRPDLHCRFRVTAPRAGADWAHIYSVAQLAGGELLAVDTTLPGYRTGREAPHARQADFRSF